MKNTSQTWKTLFADESHFTEIRVRVGSAVNLFPWPYKDLEEDEEAEISGVTLHVNRDTTLTLNGEAGVTKEYFCFCDSGFGLPAGTYTVSLNANTPECGVTMTLLGSGNTTICSVSDEPVTFELESDVQSITIKLSATAGTEFSNLVIRPQIETGNDGHLWEVPIAKTGGEVPDTEVLEYGMDVIREIKIDQSLIPDDVPAVGGAVSCSCEVTLMEKSINWPRMAKFEVSVRLLSEDKSIASEWVSMGVFYTDERAESKYGGLLTIIGYDGMLLFERSWTDKITGYEPEYWPITAKAWADTMEKIGMFHLNGGMVLDDVVGLVGLNTISTVRDVLKTIAAAHGGNWAVTPDGSLRLVPYSNMDTGTAAIAGIAIAGIAVVGDSHIEIADGAEYTFIGMKCSSLDTSPAFEPITKVALETDSGNIARAGEDEGYELHGVCNFIDSAGVGALCLSHVEGYIYKPFVADRARMDPAAEAGDLVIIDGRPYQMMIVSWTLNAKPTADISAPYDAEVDHEYTYLSEAGKTYRKAMEEDQKLEERIYSSIQQTENSIITQVGQTYMTINGAEQQYVTIQSTINQTKDAIELEIQDVTDEFDELRMHYRFDAEGETIGKEGSPKSLRLANDAINMYVEDEIATSWTPDEMYTPKKVRIPYGGSLQLGPVLQIPRSSGNVSAVWVG